MNARATMRAYWTKSGHGPLYACEPFGRRRGCIHHPDAQQLLPEACCGGALLERVERRQGFRYHLRLVSGGGPARMRWRVPGRLVIAAIASAKLFAHGGVAQGAGYLNEVGCLGQPGSGCSDIDRNSVIGDAQQVLPSPDVGHAYAITSTINCSGNGCEPDAVSMLDRSADGRLSFGSCVSTSTSRGCAGLAHAGVLAGIADAVISPDARDLYVASYYGESVVHFRLASDGRASYADCIGDADYGCTEMPDQEQLGQVTKLAMSADGRDLYVID